MLKAISFLKPNCENTKSVGKIKTSVSQLLNNLLNSKDSESRAGGLNILGSLCGFGSELYSQGTYFPQFHIKDFLYQFSHDFNQQRKERIILPGCKLI